MTRRKRRETAERLRRAVGCLPEHTRTAMLEAVRGDRLIAGAYSDRSGGVCPMLAAHRRGGRTDLASFARAWDRYTAAKRSRPATSRELASLEAMLTASLAAEPAGSDLAGAVADVKRSRAERAEAEARGGATVRTPRRDTGERDRSAELHDRAGWGWTRPVRRLDAFEATLARLGESGSKAPSPPEPSPSEEAARPERLGV